MQVVSYLFSPIPGTSWNYTTWLIAYGIALCAIAVILKVVFTVYKNNKALKRTLRSAPGQFAWTGIILLILAGSRINGVPYLSMRFLLFVIIALSVFYIVKSIYKMIRVYPEMKKLVEKPDEKQNTVVYSTKKNK